MKDVFRRRTQVARAESRRKGLALQPAEVIELYRGGKGDERVHEHIRYVRGQKSDDDEHGDLRGEHESVSAEISARLFAEAEQQLAQKDPRKKEEDGHEVSQRPQPVAAREPDGEQDHVARLRVGEHATPRHEGVCVEESACQAEHEPDLQPFVYGKRRKFFPKIPHASIVPSPRRKVNVFLKEAADAIHYI